MATNPGRPWDEAEQATVRGELIRLATEQPGISLTRAIDLAQKKLHRLRRKVINKPWSLDWLNLPEGLYKRQVHGAHGRHIEDTGHEEAAPVVEQAAPVVGHGGTSEPLQLVAAESPDEDDRPDHIKRRAETLKRRIAAGEVKLGIRKDGAKRVFWKEDERRRIAVQTVSYMLLDPTLTKYEALIMAQEQVFAEQPERKRNFASWASELKEWLEPLMNKVRPEIFRARQEAQAAKEREAQAERDRIADAAAAAAAAAAKQAEELAAQLAAESAARQAAEAAARALPVANPAGDALAVLFGAFRQRIVNEVASIFTEAMQQAMGNMMQFPPQPSQPSEGKERATAANPFPHNPFPPGHEASEEVRTEPVPRHVPFVREAPRPAKKSVCVVGLRGGQMEVLKAEYGDVLDLRFHGAGDSKHQLRDLATNCDSTVLFTDMMGHSTEQLVRARSKDWHRSGGGMTSLRATLDKLIPPGARMQ